MKVQQRNKNAITGNEMKMSTNGVLEVISDLGAWTRLLMQTPDMQPRNLVRVNSRAEMKKVVVMRRM